jgi:hypothetical protein
MCLYPVFGLNPKYRPNKKNRGKVPPITDLRLKWVPFKCGKCMECRKQKANEWKIRLSEELRTEFGYFVTLTFSDTEFEKLENELGYKRDEDQNTIATVATRRFLERVRKDTGKSLKHWFVTELGEEKDRLHLHGIIFGQKGAELCRKHWKYGGIYVGTYCNERSINYTTKYMLKQDIKHKDYTQIVLCSKGIGENWVERKRKDGWMTKNYKKILVPTYTFRNGTKCAIPKYYKDKLFDEIQRETMWLNVLDKGELYIGGEKVKADDEETIENLRKFYRNIGKQTFNDRPDYWDEQKAKRRYERQRKYVLDEKRRKLRKNVEQEKELQEITKRIKTGQKARWRENYIFSQSSGCPF